MIHAAHLGNPGHDFTYCHLAATDLSPRGDTWIDPRVQPSLYTVECPLCLDVINGTRKQLSLV